MSEFEVIQRLRWHIKAIEMQKGFISNRDIYYCESYIMDFLLINRERARQFLNDRIIKQKTKAVTKDKRSVNKWNVILRD